MCVNRKEKKKFFFSNMCLRIAFEYSKYLRGLEEIVGKSLIRMFMV